MSYIFSVISIMASILLLMPVASASDVEQIASLMWGYNRDVAVRGDYAFCTVGYGLIVFDISSAGDPEEVSRLFLASPGVTAGEIVLYGDYAYIRLGINDLAIADISDPADPQLLSNYQTSKQISKMMIQGNLIYYTSGDHSYENELHILDVSDPENPVLRGSFTDGWGSYPFKGFDIDGAYACLTSYNDGFLVLDISDPDDPTVAIQYDPVNTIYAARMENNLIFAAAGEAGLIVFNLFDPYGPTEVDRFDTYPVSDLAIGGNYAYLETDNAYNSYSVIDISNPANLTLVADNPDSMIAISGMEVIDDRLFLRNKFEPTYDGYGLQIIDITDPHNNTLWCEYFPPNGTDVLYAYGNYVYAGHALRGFSIIDISNPALPVEVGHSPKTGRCNGLSVDGNYAYLTTLGDSNLYVVDISNPAVPVIVGTFEAANRPSQVVARDNYVYLIDEDYWGDNSRLLILDVTDHSAPQQVAEYKSICQAPVLPKCLDIEGDYLYLGYWKSRSGDGYTGLHILDITDPTDPQLVSIYKEGVTETHAFYGVDVVGDYAYITFRGDIDLMVLDVSDPADPLLVASVPTPSEPEYILNYNICVSDNRAYVSATHNGLKVFDLYNIYSPIRTDKFSTPGLVCDAAKVGDYLYLADLYGLMVVSAEYYEPTAGDVNNDEEVNVGDIVYLINFVFKNGMAPYYMRASDVNKDVTVNVGDVVYLINYIFKDGPAPLK